MRLLPVLRVATALLFVASIVLGIVTMRAMNDTRRWLNAASDAAMGYSLAERTLQVDLLNARAGLLRDDDPVNGDLASARENLAGLRKLSLWPETADSLAMLIDRTGREEGLVEQFRSDTILLQKAMARFTANSAAETGAHNLLSARILKLTLDTSPHTVHEAREALDSLRHAPAGTPAAHLISDARLLVAVLPEIDGLLQAIRSMHMDSRIERLQDQIRAESRDRSNVVHRLQASLAGTIILLIASVIALVLVQRLHTRDLEAQAANARLSAAIATPLIDTGQATFAARVQDAVHRLAIHIGAKRLQLAIPGMPDATQFSWPHGDPDPDWLRRLADAAEADRAWDGDRVIASRTGDMAAGALDGAMLAAGIGDLVLLRTAEPMRVVIGFEPEGAAVAQRRDHMAGLASAIVAIAHGARREAMQRERDRLERTLSRARRMETIGAMASGVAHNFNNIIGAIGGFAEMGQERTRSGSPARAHFEEILAAVRRARDLVDDILNFAKQGRSSKTPLNLFDVLAETVRLLSATARGANAFQFQASDRCYPVMGSGSELQQVFLNICNNAGHAGGRRPVTIISERVRLTEERHLSHGSLDPGSYVVVAVSDDGPGIPDVARQRLFEPFFTTKAGGSGLGLSTAWEIVQDHGGTIHVENPSGGGARFSVWLPEVGEKKQAPMSGDGARILLLTEPERLAGDEELLAELGYEPLGFAIGTDVETLGMMVADSDAVLVAAFRPDGLDTLVRAITPLLGTRPLLLASPGKRFDRYPAGTIRLSYPIDPDELSRLLWESRADARCGGELHERIERSPTDM